MTEWTDLQQMQDQLDLLEAKVQEIKLLISQLEPIVKDGRNLLKAINKRLREELGIPDPPPETVN